MPLLFDLPLEKLLTYQGSTPKPDDFDAFWDNGLREMRAVDPEVRLVPAPFQAPFADCFDLTFTGVGGSRIYAKLLRPKVIAEPSPAVVMFHGYSGNSGEWVDKLPYVAMGCTVAAMDCRGQGGRSQDLGGVSGTTLRGHIIRGLDDAPERLLFRQVFLDAAQLAGLVMAMDGVDPARVGVTGGSQGGGLTLACAALEPRVRRAAPVYPFLCDYRRVWLIDQAKDAYQELKDYFRRHDPRHEQADEVFRRLAYIDVQFLCPRIRAEVMMGVGFCDTVCPPSTQFAAYNRIAAPKRYVAYPDFGHEALPGHADLVFEFLRGL